MRNISPLSAMNLNSKYDWALDQLKHAQVRLTPVREKVLGFLARQTVPVTLHDISMSEDLVGQFDDATVYRTLVLLVELEVARQLQFHGRSACFVMNVPGECFSFLVCRCCGAITRIPHGEQLHSLEQQIEKLHDYKGITHELELYGVCPTCQGHTSSCCKPNKLLPGLRLHGRSNN
jgi:Fe2+ or Zn2+ uptake regulation protein